MIVISDTSANPRYMGLCRDGGLIHVSSFAGDAVVYLTVEDVDGLFGELQGKEGMVALEPTDQSWGIERCM